MKKSPKNVKVEKIYDILGNPLGFILHTTKGKKEKVFKELQPKSCK